LDICAEAQDAGQAIVLRDVCKDYQTPRHIRILSGVSLRIDTGSICAIVGQSGAGKTTLLQILGLLDQPDKGEITICGEPASSLPAKEKARLRLRKLGFIFQGFNLLPHLKAWENVAFPLLANPGIPPGRRRRLALDLLATVDLAGRAEYYPRQLSGGEQQRVAIARALANDPAFLLADEPTGSIDVENEGRVLEILRGLAAAGRGVAVVTHHEQVAQAADVIYSLAGGTLERRTR